MTEKPLNVKVAEALGWQNCEPFDCFGVRDGSWVGDTSEPDPRSLSGLRPGGFIPSYDTDWSAGGPLLERFGIWLHPGDHIPWVAQAQNCTVGAATPLEAVCYLILALAKDGKLEAR